LILLCPGAVNYIISVKNAVKSLRIICFLAVLPACALWADTGARAVDSAAAARASADEWHIISADSVRPFAELTPSLLDLSVHDTGFAPHGPEEPKSISEAELTRLRHNMNYTGASLSAVIPGSGQLYQGRYWMGLGFLAAEAGAVGFTAYWWDAAGTRKGTVRRWRDSAAVNMGRFDELGDSLYLRTAGAYGAAADQASFEERQARYTAYNAMAWAAGIYAYNLLDALEAGGLSPRGEYRSPTAAGLLAAVPFLGLGQIYNKRPGKAGMIAMTQTSLALTAINHHRLMTVASERYNTMRDPESDQYAYRTEYQPYWAARYDRSFSRRNTYLWISLATYIYSILDAVVDAHLSDYQHKIDIGTDLAVNPAGTGFMLALTYRF